MNLLTQNHLKHRRLETRHGKWEISTPYKLPLQQEMRNRSELTKSSYDPRMDWRELAVCRTSSSVIGAGLHRWPLVVLFGNLLASDACWVDRSCRVRFIRRAMYMGFCVRSRRWGEPGCDGVDEGFEE